MSSFGSTRWSLVADAGNSNSAVARTALESLCQAYWFPVYAYLRRRTGNAHTAEDLTQDFFTRLLEGEFFAQADPSRGKFRGFLLTALRNLWINSLERQAADKRGGGRTVLSLEFTEGESRYVAEPADSRTPEAIFERQWAITVLDRVLARVESDYADAGKKETYDLLKPFLIGDTGNVSYAVIAGQLGTTEQAARAAVYRMRQHYRATLRKEIAETMHSPDGVEAEIRHLQQALEV